MSGNERKRGLGRGLSALMSDVAVERYSAGAPQPRGVQTLPVEAISPNPDQPRRRFDKTALDELAASIKEKGIIQPLVVRAIGSNSYQIVAGERRWRAAQQAQLHEVPVVVRDFTDLEVVEIAIIENVQRADLNPIEEATGYRQLMEKFGHTQEKLSEALGKSRSHIANLLRLLQLPETVRSMVEEGRLSAGHARALITSDNPEDLAREVVAKGLSVRATEALVKARAAAITPRPARSAASPEKDADTRALEGDLSAALGMSVTITHGAAGEGGTVSIRYKTLEQLDDLCGRLSGF